MAETFKEMVEGIRRANFEVAEAVAERRKKEGPPRLRGTRTPPNSFPKKCEICGKIFNVVEWNELPFIGYQPVGDDKALEMRNCDGPTEAPGRAACGNSMSLTVIL